MATSGTARVGQTPVVVLGPLDQDILVQNQSSQRMGIWLTADLEVDPIELRPFGRMLAPEGSEGIVAVSPMSKGDQTNRLFYSSLSTPDGAYVTLTRG